MAGTFVNTSKEIMAFSDFPPPPETPNFPHHSVALYYLECYAKHFSLTKWIHFKTEVQNVGNLKKTVAYILNKNLLAKEKKLYFPNYGQRPNYRSLFWVYFSK
jgi:dimethylaniline monooxygenase (N-oxide forming)